MRERLAEQDLRALEIAIESGRDGELSVAIRVEASSLELQRDGASIELVRALGMAFRELDRGEIVEPGHRVGRPGDQAIVHTPRRLVLAEIEADCAGGGGVGAPRQHEAVDGDDRGRERDPGEQRGERRARAAPPALEQLLEAAGQEQREREREPEQVARLERRPDRDAPREEREGAERRRRDQQRRRPQRAAPAARDVAQREPGAREREAGREQAQQREQRRRAPLLCLRLERARDIGLAVEIGPRVHVRAPPDRAIHVGRERVRIAEDARRKSHEIAQAPHARRLSALDLGHQRVAARELEGRSERQRGCERNRARPARARWPQSRRRAAPRGAAPARRSRSSSARTPKAASSAASVTRPLNFVSSPRPSNTPVAASAASGRRAESSLATKLASAAAPSSVEVISLPGIGLMK